MEESKNRRSSFLVQGSILAGASIISRLVGLIYRIPLNNIIGDEGSGIYSNAFKIYNICLILSCYSIPTAVSRLVAAKYEKREHRNAYRVLLCSLAFSITVGLIGSLILYFGADFFSLHLFKNQRCILPIKVLAPNILIFSVMGVLRGFFQGKNTMLPTSISQILEQIVNAIVSLAAAYSYMMAHSASVDMAGYGAAGGTLGTVVGSLAGLLFLIFIFSIFYPMLKRQMHKDHTEYLDTYPQTVKSIVVTIVPIILSQTVYQISGLLDASLFHDIMSKKGYDVVIRDTWMGIYANKYELLTNVPIAIATAIGVAIVPSIVASMTRKNYGEVKKKIHSAIKFNMIIAIPSAVGLGVLAKPIILLLFPGSTAESITLSTQLLQIGSVAVVFVALSTTSNAILQSLNRLRIPVYHSSIALVLHLIVVYVLLRFTSAKLYALVIGYILFALIVCILNWRYIRVKLSYRQELIKTFVLPSLAAVMMGVLTFVTYEGVHKLLHSNLISVLASVIVSIVVYFLLLVFMHAVSERELMNLPKGEKLVRIFKKIHLI